MKLGYKTGWLLLLLLLVFTVTIVFVPVWLIQPFAPQTERGLTISYYFKSLSPILTAVFSLAAILLAVFMWRKAKRWYSKIPVLLPLPIIFFFTWFAQQNHFEWMFNPLHQAKFASVADTDFVKDGDMVLAVKINGDAAAFPVLQMAYHHVAQDVVGGTPITATY
jgi:membrane protease YdiL (CAAX protease family)